IAGQVFVIDSASTDRTVAIASEKGAIVLQHPFVNYAKQFQWALDNAPITANWVMRLDADEVIEPDLALEIKEKLHLLPSSVIGINLNRKHIFLGRWIKHGGRYPLLLLRIWRRGTARIEDRWMDEHMIISGGQTVTFNGGFADCNLNDLTFFTQKHNKYASREAVDVINQRRDLFPRPDVLSLEGSSWQASIKRLIKEQIYNHVPFQFSATGYFLLRYFIQLGFLDGREGLIYHFLQGLWYRFLVGAKILEYERAIAGLDDKEAIKRQLSKLTGLRII
ncbi:MAG TPA: glycosyltransferase family 2 protein, partial [Beijerinckia sp.]|nr:glycosyltransferase family 2 protein [Beijerinckia sp.]